MEVITDRPIYSYANAEEKAAKRAAKKAKKEANPQPNIFQKTYEGAKKLLESDYGRAGVGVFAQKAKNFSEQTSGRDNGGLDAGQVQAYSREQIEAEKEKEAQLAKEKKRKMWRNVGIGVGVVAVLGIATFFIIKSRKNKTAKK